jgi:hypothetical protein
MELDSAPMELLRVVTFIIIDGQRKMENTDLALGTKWYMSMQPRRVQFTANNDIATQIVRRAFISSPSHQNYNIILTKKEEKVSINRISTTGTVRRSLEP